MRATCSICGVREAREGSVCAHPLCAAAAIWRGLGSQARNPRTRTRAEARAFDAERRAIAVALIERRRVS